MSGRALKHGGGKAKLHASYLKEIRNESSAYHYCPCCPRYFKLEVHYKAHYKIAHVRPK